ncbi:MAG: putative NEK/NEK2 protein kinase, partial [Streblomastix strix]
MGNNLSDQITKYQYENFNIIESLQTGAFGRIYMVELKNTKEQFIMKRLSYISEKEKKMADEEIAMLKLAQSKYTVQLIDCFSFDVDICILQEFCSGGNLRDLIKKMETWTVDDKLNKCYIIFFQVLMSLKHLHSLKIVHRDLKPENIFLDKDGNAKTGDFGLALKMASFSQVYAAGTQCYQPPEALTQNKMAEASDIWALGVIVVEMFTGVHPFQGRTLDETVQNIKNGRFKPIPEYIQGELKEMIIKMMEVDSLKRPTADELLNSNTMQLLSQIENENDEIEKNNLMLQLIWLHLPITTLQQIGEDLMKPLEGTEEKQREILKIQENKCEIIISNIKEKVDNYIRKRIVNSSLIEGILFIFTTRDLTSITRTYSQAFLQIVDPTSDEIKLLIYNKQPYPGLVHLLERTDGKIAGDAIISIFLLLETGSNTTPDTKLHPQFETIQECDGVYKIFALFQKNVNKYSRDRAALCIGFLFRSKQITNQEMKQEIINHLKSLLSDSEEWVKERAKTALKYLAQNEANRSDILTEDELKRIEQDLKQPFEREEEQKESIILNQETDLLLLSLVLEDRNDDELRNRIISSGIVENLLFAITNRDLGSISRSFSSTFFDLISPASDEIKILIYNKNPYPGLIQLLVHANYLVASDAIISIFNILQAGISSAPNADPHPHYESILSCDGIKKIFVLFQKNISKYSRDRAALCIGFLFRSKQITNKEMKQEIINHLKSLLCDSDAWVKERAQIALKYLAQNDINRSEILNDEELKNIEQDLKQQIEGEEEQQKSILHRQEIDLFLLTQILKDQYDDDLRKRIISSGIIESLLFIFEMRDLSSISRMCSYAFFALTAWCSNEINILLSAKKLFPGLIRMLG